MRLKALFPIFVILSSSHRAALSEDATTAVPTKELLAAIHNQDIEWDGTVIGLLPHTRGASSLVSTYCLGEIAPDLVAALDDPERFAAAHLLLGHKWVLGATLSADGYDELRVSLDGDGHTTIDPGQRPRLKKLWSERLKKKPLVSFVNPPSRPGFVRVTVKDLVKAIHNHDVAWGAYPGGLLPDIKGSTRLVDKYGGKESDDLLVSAVDDPDRFVAAHVLLTKLLKNVDTTGGDRFDCLQVHLGAPTVIDPAQRTTIKKIWVDRLRPRPDGSRDPLLKN
jgi:hypothetical protein